MPEMILLGLFVICHLWSFCTLILIILHSVRGFFFYLLFRVHLVSLSSPYVL